MKIAILDDYQDAVKNLACFDSLRGHEVKVLTQSYSDPQQLAAKLQGVEALVLIRERTEISEALLRLLPSLRVISQTGKVSAHIDVALCQRYGVRVLEGVGSPVAPAELCWALIMAASRHIPQYYSALKNGQWQQNGGLGLGRSLNGRTLGIWGYGKIGQRIAGFGRAFGMQVQIWGSEASRQQAQDDGYLAAQTRSAFFATSDVLSLHLRLNDVTRSIVTAEDLAQMKSDSLFVNISRAELVEPGALYQELLANPSKQAALDVYEQEPADSANQPLLSLANVTALPHIGYVEQNSYQLYFKAALDNLLAFIAGESGGDSTSG